MVSESGDSINAAALNSNTNTLPSERNALSEVNEPLKTEEETSSATGPETILENGGTAVQELPSETAGSSNNVALADSMDFPSQQGDISKQGDLQETSLPMDRSEVNAPDEVNDASHNPIQLSNNANAALADSLESSQSEPSKPIPDVTEVTNV